MRYLYARVEPAHTFPAWQEREEDANRTARLLLTGPTPDHRHPLQYSPMERQRTGMELLSKLHLSQDRQKTLSRTMPSNLHPPMLCLTLTETSSCNLACDLEWTR